MILSKMKILYVPLLVLVVTIGVVFAQDEEAHTVGEHYTFLPGGVCRGPGGPNDHINSMSAIEHTQALCEETCDSRKLEDSNGAHCLGYSYCSNCNGGECILFGPGLSGTCSDPSIDNAYACEALGSCDSPNTATKDTECGTCKGKSSALEESSCESLDGTWEKGTWTSAEKTWDGADDPFTGDSHPSKFIAGTSDEKASDYSCYDIIINDHLAQCTGNSTECINAFDDLVNDSDQVEENCPEGCVFTAKPKGPKNPPVVHAPDIKLPGWDPAQSGACRGGADFSGKVNGKYSNTAGANGTLTQLECADACIAEESCVGYAHATNWCIVYGPDAHLGFGTEEDGVWTSDNHEEIKITGTKANIAYICITVSSDVSDSSLSQGDGSSPPDDSDGSITSKDDSGSPVLSKSLRLNTFLLLVMSACL